MKIDRALIIRRLKVPSSMEYADICAKSCEQFNLPYEFIDGIEFMSSEDAFKAVGCWKHPDFNWTEGHNNCHASHIKAWRRMIEIGKPCLILEHDAVIMGETKNIDIPEMSVVTFGHRVNFLEQYSPISEIKELIQIPRALGAHAYSITPKTAEFILKVYDERGVFENVDEWLIRAPSSGLPLFVTEPPQVVCWPRISTRELQLNNNKIETAPTWTWNEALTPGWIKGLK